LSIPAARYSIRKNWYAPVIKA